jgi:hypothetical protein
MGYDVRCYLTGLIGYLELIQDAETSSAAEVHRKSDKAGKAGIRTVGRVVQGHLRC